MFVVVARDCDPDRECASRKLHRCGGTKSSACNQRRNPRVKRKDAIRQSLVENALIECGQAASVEPTIWNLTFRAIEIVVCYGPIEAGEYELLVTWRESDDLESGGGAHADTPLSWVMGTVSCREVEPTSFAMSELSCGTCIT